MKKHILLVTTFIMVVCITAVVAICSMAGIGKQYIIKKDQIKAAVVDITDVFSVHDSEEVFIHKLNEMTGYFKENDINTAIVQFNENKQGIVSVGTFSNEYEQAVYLKDRDILTKLKEPVQHRLILILMEMLYLTYHLREDAMVILKVSAL